MTVRPKQMLPCACVCLCVPSRVCTGTVWADTVTGNGAQRVAVGAGGEIDIFDGGVRPTHELGMEYVHVCTQKKGAREKGEGRKHHGHPHLAQSVLPAPPSCTECVACSTLLDWL